MAGASENGQQTEEKTPEPFSGESQRKRMSSITSVRKSRRSTLRGSERISGLKNADSKRLNANRRVTLTFFIVGVIFMAIAFPISIIATIYGLPQLYNGVLQSISFDDSLIVTLQLRFPFVFIAFIDPILYAFSNEMVKEKLKQYFKRLCCCRRNEIANR